VSFIFLRSYEEFNQFHILFKNGEKVKYLFLQLNSEVSNNNNSLTALN